MIPTRSLQVYPLPTNNLTEKVVVRIGVVGSHRAFGSDPKMNFRMLQGLWGV